MVKSKYPGGPVDVIDVTPEPEPGLDDREYLTWLYDDSDGVPLIEKLLKTYPIERPDRLEPRSMLERIFIRLFGRR